MDKKELKIAYENQEVFDILYAYVTDSITGRSAKRLFEKKDMEHFCVETILTKLNVDETKILKQGADCLQDMELLQEIWDFYVVNPKMPNIIEMYPQIKQAYQNKLARVERSKEMVITMHKDNISPFDDQYYKDYKQSAFGRLPNYFCDKHTLIEIIKYFKSGKSLINIIKHNNPELFKDPEVVAEVIMLINPKGDLSCSELKLEVTNSVYEKAAELARPRQIANKKQVENEEKKDQKIKDQKIKEEKKKIWSDIDEILSISPDTDYIGINSYRDRIFIALLYLMEHPLSIEKIVKIGYTSYEKFEELINYYNTNLDKSENNGDLDDVEKEALERAYKIYGIIKKFEDGKIKLVGIPAGCFGFDDVVEKVTQIAKSKIEAQAKELTKDINSTGEVGEKIAKKIKDKTAKVCEEIEQKRKEYLIITEKNIDEIDDITV